MTKTIIRAAAVILAALAILSLAACGNDTSADVDVQKLTDDMRAAARWPELLSIRSGDSREQKGFAAISDMDYERVDDFSLLYAADGSAYELAVIRLKDETDMKELEGSLGSHIESRVSQYRFYDAEQAPRAESAVVVTKGRYAALIMCDDIAAVRTVFEKAFE